MHIPTPRVANLLDIPDAPTRDERFEDVLRHPGVRIERIISHGHTTPADQPYLQSWDEWVMLLAGTAELELDGISHYSLRPGDHLLIPAGIAHRVTHSDQPTIWLAIHIGENGQASSS